MESDYSREDSLILQAAQAAIEDQRMINLTAGLLAVAVAQGVMFGWQLYMMRQTVKDATAAARAAMRSAELTEESVRLSRETSTIELRAYVGLKGFEVIPVYQAGSKKIIQWGIAPRIVNAGQTPAQITSFNVSFATFDDALPDDFDFAAIDPDTESSSATLASAETILGSTAPVNRGVVMTVAMRQSRGYMWGEVVYRDVFPGTPERKTQFAAEMFVRGDPLDDDPDKLSLRNLPRHNVST